MAVSVGQPAPDFTLRDTTGTEHTLSAYRGKPVVLFFFPAAFTRTCERQVSETHHQIARYRELGAEVFGVSADLSPAQAAFARNCGVDSYPILSDATREVITKYGVLRQGPGLPSERATFLIDADGVVRWAKVEDNPGQWIGTGGIVEELQKLGGREAPPAAAGS